MQLLWLCLAALLLWVARLLTLTLWRHRGSDAWLRRLIALADADEHSLAVDCTSPVCPSLTHHRGGSEPALASGCALACAADTSGGLVLAAAAAGHPWLQRRSVACNHFDMDALVAVFAALQPADALRHADVLSAAAHLGDFREVLASPASSAAWAAALLLNVWANSVEATRFSRPFDGGDGPGRGTGAKWDFFLPRLPLALAEAAAAGAAVAASAGKHEDTMAGSLFLAHLPRGSLLCEAGAAFCAELERVWAETALLRNAPGGSLVVHADVGLAVVSPPPGCCPLHYYSLFGPTAGCDAVLSLYGGRLYEARARLKRARARSARARTRTCVRVRVDRCHTLSPSLCSHDLPAPPPTLSTPCAAAGA